MAILNKTFKRFFLSNFWKYILLPFLTSRLVLILVAWFAQYFTASADYAQYAKRGYFISPFFLVDIWSRWDAQWYLAIVKSGYAPFLASSSTSSNIAFFPLYPLLVKVLSFPFNLAGFSQTLTLAVGILISCLSFLAAAFLLYKMITELFQDEGIAQRAILLMIAFPAGFFFSTFYPESLFLFLSIALFYAAFHKRWLLAACLGGLATLSRPLGIFLLVPLFWMYMEDRQWKVKAVRIDFLSFLIPPLSLAGFWGYLFSLTGDPLALLHAEAGWGRLGGSSLGNLLQQLGSHYKYVFRIDAGLFLVFLAAVVYLLIAKRLAARPLTKAFGLYAILMIGFPILTGVWISLSRFLVVAFPVFIVLAWASQGQRFANRRRELFILLLVFFTLIQVLYFAGWTSYYFIA